MAQQVWPRIYSEYDLDHFYYNNILLVIIDITVQVKDLNYNSGKLQ